MPISCPVACDAPGCMGYAIPHSSYCAKHQPVREEREADKKRYQNNPWRGEYNKARWRNNTQPAVTARDPICKLMITPLCKQHGGDPTKVADHIIDHKGDMNLFYDMNNLRGACKPCHDRKTGLTRGGAKIHGPHCLMRQNAGFCTCPVNDASVPIEP
jgi:5-methylcytosine-specific restriction protein A